jgi:hypothetical protein
VAAALRGHLETWMVQHGGCCALARLADKHPANQAAAGEAGAPGLVAAAMRGHPEEKDVQYAGCRALWSLAENHPANTAAAREAGCVQLVAAALRASPESKYLPEDGRAALEILEPGHALLAGGARAVHGGEALPTPAAFRLRRHPAAAPARGQRGGGLRRSGRAAVTNLAQN